MKLIKLSEDHYIICDDSEIKEGDLVRWRKDYNVGQIVNNAELNWSEWQKVTHSTQPLAFLNVDGFTTANLKPDWTNVEYLPLSEVKELLGVVDVEKKAFIHTNTLTDYLSPKEFSCMKEGYVIGYNQAIEDNKEKKWTDEDVIKIVEKSRQTGLTAEYLMLSLQLQTEWEVEMIDGKLKLK